MLCFYSSFFGIHTLQEFQSFTTECRETIKQGKTCILILGLVPAGISLQLDFVQDVFIYYSDDEPQMDLDYIQTFFGIGVFSVIYYCHSDCSLYM